MKKKKVATKTNPIGVRFQKEKLQFVKDFSKIKTPQGILDFLFDNYDPNPKLHPVVAGEPVTIILTKENFVKPSSGNFKVTIDKDSLVYDGDSIKGKVLTIEEIPEISIDKPQEPTKTKKEGKATQKENKALVEAENASKYHNVISEIDPKAGDMQEINKALHDGVLEKLSKTKSIEEQIKAIQSEKIPDHRNTPIGKQSWKYEQQKRITELKSKL